MSWRAAFGYCAQTGGHLAVIDNAAEHNLIHSIHLLHQTRTTKSNSTWVDGTDFVLEDTWMCPSIGAACPFLRWGSGQPSNHGGNQNCLGFHPAVTDGLNDIWCDGEEQQFGLPLCEYEYECDA